jgi:hypothetical protein
LILGWSDKQLIDAYQQTDGRRGNREAELLLREMKRRNLDI